LRAQTFLDFVLFHSIGFWQAHTAFSCVEDKTMMNIQHQRKKKKASPWWMGCSFVPDQSQLWEKGIIM